ncbi:uncharacterized protein BDZ99DRAFT_502635 [Mytilinidion resinicola]|uniref:Uncharacterized protein n=1 Tax=Mytilinidion resinicola TaxID=574789 RepID=A0A6A6Y721_9PEZI|nr:uncharacterized protein BDZ99DRAFT_502635 [Mytilinidion resinicola]KAF2804490.1 hypothetical protein BDZ99DRAFT_502635 [Mytilinidion resinicola]
MASSSRLLSLPAELRQKIIEKTFTIVSDIQMGCLVLNCPLQGICQLFQADYDSVVHSWLPDPRDPTVFAALTDPNCIEDLEHWNARFQRVAAASNRTWAGIQEITLTVLLGNRVPPWKPFRYYRGQPCEHNDIRDQFECFVYNHWGVHVLTIPSFVRRVKLDMTVPRETLERKLAQWDAGWTAQPPWCRPIYPMNLGHHFPDVKADEGYCFRQLFWLALFDSVEEWVDLVLESRARRRGLSRRDVGEWDSRGSIPALTVEIIGELPASQVEALVPITGEASFWRDTWSEIFAAYTKGVIERIEANTKDEG